MRRILNRRSLGSFAVGPEIGFGLLVRTDGQYNTELSTTDQFKLPRRL